ncbi:MAG: gamma-glutamyltransferase, partial [Hyphomonas sp.]|nr:gamma-glutamyltransferase [Hyphomonas sp.]
MNHIRNLFAAALAASLVSCATPAPEALPEIEIVGVPGPGPGSRMPTGREMGVRSAVVAPQAAAATAHPLATQVALDVMKQGGSAVDAAIAANAMLGLVEPVANGIGGDLFAIVWDPKTQTLYGYNGSGRSAKGTTLADMQAKADDFMEGKDIPYWGAAPVTVPGTVDAWYALHDKFGRRPMNSNLEPAIQYARSGAPIPEVIAYYWNRSAELFPRGVANGMIEEFDNARKTYFDPPPREGSLFRNPDLANTLERIAYKGRDEFYTGETAHIMGDYFERIGGFLRYEDFAAHTGEWVEPLCAEYRGDYKICELPPNTQGVAALQMLQMLEPFDLRDMGYASADSIAAQVEAKRLAFHYRAKGYADPLFAGIAPEEFIREDRSRLLSSKIDVNTPISDVRETINATETQLITGSADGCKVPDEFDINGGWVLYPPLSDDCQQVVMLQLMDLMTPDAKLQNGDTTYLTVADKDGMMVSLIQSNFRGMGSGLVADGLGFMFQDRGQLFSLDPAHPNVWEPGKRPFHTIIPAFAFRKDMPGCQVRAVPIEMACPFEPWMSFGLMGGAMQP